MYGEVLRDVVRQFHEVSVATVQRYMAFINFQASVHNVILEPWKDPTKHAH